MSDQKKRNSSLQNMKIATNAPASEMYPSTSNIPSSGMRNKQRVTKAIRKTKRSNLSFGVINGFTAGSYNRHSIVKIENAELYERQMKFEERMYWVDPLALGFRVIEQKETTQAPNVDSTMHQKDFLVKSDYALHSRPLPFEAEVPGKRGSHHSWT